jgi:hypothetical protein
VTGDGRGLIAPFLDHDEVHPGPIVGFDLEAWNDKGRHPVGRSLVDHDSDLRGCRSDDSNARHRRRVGGDRLEIDEHRFGDRRTPGNAHQDAIPAKCLMHRLEPVRDLRGWARVRLRGERRHLDAVATVNRHRVTVDADCRRRPRPAEHGGMRGTRTVGEAKGTEIDSRVHVSPLLEALGGHVETGKCRPSRARSIGGTPG